MGLYRRGTDHSATSTIAAELPDRLVATRDFSESPPVVNVWLTGRLVAPNEVSRTKAASVRATPTGPAPPIVGRPGPTLMPSGSGPLKMWPVAADHSPAYPVSKGRFRTAKRLGSLSRQITAGSRNRRIRPSADETGE